MKLTASQNSGAYPKFNSIGDVVSGAFVSFDSQVPGKFGPEDLLVLQDRDGLKTVRCPSMLGKIMRENSQHLVEGSKLTITYTADVPTNKGKPAKVFDVDLQPPSTGQRPVTREVNAKEELRKAAAQRNATVQANLGDDDLDVGF